MSSKHSQFSAKKKVCFLVDKLQKFTSTGELIKCVGRKGGKEGEFDDPHGLTLRDNLVYVCDLQ